MNKVLHNPTQSEREKVEALFRKQQRNNFKPGWVYYQCKKLNLLPAFESVKVECKNRTAQPSATIKLTIELVPETCWFSNVRSEVSDKEWAYIKKVTNKAANFRCEICGGKGPKWPVECHEIWYYDDVNKIQRLKGIQSLCPSCHEVKHIGLAGINNREEIAIKHLAKVNSWDYKMAENYVQQQGQQWHDRSQYEWTLDINYLKKYNINITNSRNTPQSITKPSLINSTNHIQRNIASRNITRPTREPRQIQVNKYRRPMKAKRTKFKFEWLIITLSIIVYVIYLNN